MNYFNELFPLLPELILSVLVLVVITVDLFLRRDLKWILTPLTVFGLILAGIACPIVWGTNANLLSGFYKVDDLSVFLKGATMLIGILSALFAPSYLRVRRLPLHYWTPDAYQGAPTPLTGFLSVGPKLGAFALLIRIFVDALGPMRADWLVVMAALAVLTMTGGNIVALTQNNVKRMLAYSSIAHTGYILAGLTAYAAAGDNAIGQRGIEAVLFYVLGYGVMNIAAFAVVGMLQRDTRRYGGLGSFAGLAARDPWRAAAMAVLLLSLTGIPPTVGFFAKLYVLVATVDAGIGWLAVVIALNAALAAFYYLRVIVTMYMRDPEAEPAPIDHAPAGNLGLVLPVVRP